jgi:hypothetical protein
MQTKLDVERCSNSFVSFLLRDGLAIWSAKTASGIGDMISQDTLPENLVARCLDVLRTLSANERDLIRLVVEVVHDLRDSSDSDDEAPVSCIQYIYIFSNLNYPF